MPATRTRHGKRYQINLTLDYDLYRHIKQMALDEDVSMTDLVRPVVEKAFPIPQRRRKRK